MGTPAAIRAWESPATLYRRIWRSSVAGSFVQPMLFLLGMGLGVGGLVDDGGSSTEILGGVSYFAFFAPSLVATGTMFVTTQEALWPVMDGFTWSNSFRSMAATPLRPTDVVDGIALWHATRSLITSVGVVAVLMCFGETRGPGLAVALLGGVLTGLAFSLPITAWSATRESDQSFPAILRFGVSPMFLFAGVFYPIDQLPDWLQVLAVLTPLWHGVTLARDAVLGVGTAGSVALHVAVLAAYALAGWVASRIAFTRRLAR